MTRRKHIERVNRKRLTDKEEQRELTEWSLNHERQLLEDIFSQRFNFLVIFVSIVIAGAMTTSNRLYFSVILWLGSFVTAIIWHSIYSMHMKLNIIASELKRLNGHPFKFVEDNYTGKRSRVALVIAIPAACFIVLFIWAVLVSVGIFAVN